MVTVYTLVNKNTGYTAYTFVDAYDGQYLTDVDVSIVGGDENSAFVYVVKYDGQHYYDANNTYFTYKVLNTETGAEEVVKADSKVISNTGDIFDLYYKARTNSDSEITALPKVPDTGKYFNHSFSGEVTFEDGVLSLGNAVADTYTLASDAEIVLITRDSKLNKDPDAKYETSLSLSGKGLANALKGYTVSGTIAGATTEAGNSKIQTLFVTVNEASAVVAPSSDASVKTLEVKGNDVAGLSEVKISNSDAKDTGKAVFNVVATDDGVADVKVFVADATSYAKDQWTAYSISNTEDISAWGTFYLKAVVTAKAGNTKTYTLKVTVAAASTVSALTVKPSVASGAITVTAPAGGSNGTIVIDKSKTGGDITVAQLKASLVVTGTASANDTIVVTDWTGTATADTTMVMSGTTLTYVADGATNLVYDITVS